MENEEKKTCFECDNFGYESPCHDQPYPEFWCIKGHWDGIGSFEELEEPVDCSDWASKGKTSMKCSLKARDSVKDAKNGVRGNYTKVAVLDDYAAFGVCKPK